ncbi:hypothetical protein CR513_41584, partial [Mucuna pruriens]
MKVSYDKSQVYFSINAFWQVKVQINEELRFQQIDDMEKYPRFLILNKIVNKIPTSIIDICDVINNVTEVQTIHSKYNCDSNILPRINVNKLGSNIWNDLKQLGRI